MEDQARHTHSLRGITTSLTIAALLLAAVHASAQDVTEPALKAAFIYNFAKFTEWPAGASTAEAPLVLCVVGDAAVGVALEQTVKGRVHGGHILKVSPLTRVGPNERCDVLYVSGVTANHAAELVAALRDAPVLTISDVEGFTERGGIALFFFEHGRLRFSVRVAAAERVGLQISSKLLILARPEPPTRGGHLTPEGTR